MAEELLNFIANDGSRQFGELPQTVLWYEMRDHLETLKGATITDFITDHVTQAWIDFTYRGYQFSVNDQSGDYWFFVDEPSCPDEILESILSHSKLLLGKRGKAKDYMSRRNLTTACTRPRIARLSSRTYR